MNKTSFGRSGRPPSRFEAEDELRILLDAGFVVMERNGYTDAAVADILREANLSTRSFYRHFESKDQLLCALYRRDADAAAADSNAKVEAAGEPAGGARRLDRRDPQLQAPPGQGRPRLAVLGSPGAMKAQGYAAETCRASKLLMAPLQAPRRRRGRRDLPAGRPGRRRAADPVRRLGAAGSRPSGTPGVTGRGGETGPLVLRAGAGRHVDRRADRRDDVAFLHERPRTRPRRDSSAFGARSSDHMAGSPSSTCTTPSISSARRCEAASPTAARRMKPGDVVPGP